MPKTSTTGARLSTAGKAYFARWISWRLGQVVRARAISGHSTQSSTRSATTARRWLGGRRRRLSLRRCRVVLAQSTPHTPRIMHCPQGDRKWRRPGEDRLTSGAGLLVGRVVEGDLEPQHAREMVSTTLLARRIERWPQRLEPGLEPRHLLREAGRDGQREPLRRPGLPGARAPAGRG